MTFAKASKAYPHPPYMDNSVLVTSHSIPKLQNMAPPRINRRTISFSYFLTPQSYQGEPSNRPPLQRLIPGQEMFPTSNCYKLIWVC